MGCGPIERGFESLLSPPCRVGAMNRRHFLKGVGFALGSLVIPWVPEVFYSIPKVVAPQNLHEATYPYWGAKPYWKARSITLEMMQEMFDRVEAEAPRPTFVLVSDRVFNFLRI